MKKFLLSIFAVMLAVFSVQAETKTYTYDFSKNTNWVTTKGGSTAVATGSSNKLNAFYDKATGDVFNADGKGYFANTTPGYFLWGASGAYIELPTYAGEKITNVTAKSSANHSTSVTVGIYSGNTSVVSAKTWSTKSASYSYDIPDQYQSDVLRLQVTNSKNSQVVSITITTETTGEGGGETPDVPALETLATPKISPASCEFNIGESLSVTISAAEGATIYYTLDGTTPTESSAAYSSALSIEATTTVKAIAVKEGFNNSEVAEAKFTAVDPNAKTTTFDFTKPADLTPSVTTFTSQAYNTTGTTFTSDGVTLNTTDGSTPSRIWDGSAYDLRVYKNATMTIAAPASGVITSIEFTGSTVSDFSANTGTLGNKKWTGNASKVVFTWSSGASTQKINTITVTYSIDESVVVIAQPSLTPAKSFVGSTTVEITNNEEGTTLYYSTNGEDYVPYTGALTISETTTVYAYAQDAQENKSDVAEATYTKINVLSIAEAKAAYDNAGEGVAVAVDLTGAVVTVNNGQYLFIENETTGINIFNSGADYAEGTKFTAGYILGTSTTYRNMHQLSNVEFCGVETTDVTVKPLEVTIADIAGNYDEYEGRFVKLTGVSIDADKNITQGDDEYKAYDRFALGFGAIANCDLTGVVAIYNTGEQLYIKDITYNLSVTDAGYATLFLDFAATVPAFEGENGVFAAKVNGNYVDLTKVEGVLPANTGVIVKAAPGEYTFTYTKEEVTVDTDLKGTATAEYITPAGTAYVLGKLDGEVALYKAELTGGEFLNNANKAYLVVENANPAAQYSFRFGEGTTGIEQITDNREQSTVIYDLTGRRVEAITAPGIYVVNGKKVLVK